MDSKAIGLIIMAVISELVFAVPKKFEVEGGAVEALVIGKPSLLRIRAKGEPARGSLAIEGRNVSGSFEFELTTLNSGIELRDDHMKNKYLKVASFPKAKLTIRDLALVAEFSPESTEVSETEFSGELTLHGVTKPIRGKFKVGEDRAIAADFKLRLTDFQIEIPSYMGITVADEVNVSVAIDKLRPVLN